MTSFFLWPSFDDSVAFMVGIKVKDIVQSLSCVIKEAVQSNSSNASWCSETSMLSLSSSPLSGCHRRCRSGDFSSVVSVDTQFKTRDCMHHRSVSCPDLSDLIVRSTHSSTTSSSTVSSISSRRHSRNASWSYAVTDSDSDSDSDISISGSDTDSDDMICKMQKFIAEVNAEASKVVDQQMSFRFDCIPELSSAIDPVNLFELAQLQGKISDDHIHISSETIDVAEECDVVASEKCDFASSCPQLSTVKSVNFSEFASLQGQMSGSHFSFQLVDLDEESHDEQPVQIRSINYVELFAGRYIEARQSKGAFKLSLRKCGSLFSFCEEDEEYQ